MREFKLYKGKGKLLKGFNQRNDSISFGKKKKKKKELFWDSVGNGLGMSITHPGSHLPESGPRTSATSPATFWVYPVSQGLEQGKAFMSPSRQFSAPNNLELPKSLSSAQTLHLHYDSLILGEQPT